MIVEIVRRSGEPHNYRYQRWDTLIIYDKPWKFRLFGFCDLYNVETGEMWELKKNSSSYTCTTAYAQDQLNNYITNGDFVKDYKAGRRLPTTIMEPGIFEKRDAFGNRYVISYWDQGGGILRYSYSIIPSEALVLAVAGAFAVGYLTNQALNADKKLAYVT